MEIKETKSRGDIFSVLPFLLNYPTSYTTIAKTDCVMLSLSYKDYKDVEIDNEKIKETTAFLKDF